MADKREQSAGTARKEEFDMFISSDFRKMAVGSFVLLMMFLLISVSSNAQTIVVDTLDDVVDELDGSTSLREAIMLANKDDPDPFDMIVFQEELAGTIMLMDGEMTITDDLTITGPGADVIAIDAKKEGRIFVITSEKELNALVDPEDNIDVTISGLKLVNGGFDAIKKTVTTSAMKATIGGGAIASDQNISLISLEFVDNSVPGSGGAVLILGPGVIEKIEDCDFTRNIAEEGGAVAAIGSNSFDTSANAVGDEGVPAFVKSITGSTFRFNSAERFGGAIYADGISYLGDIMETEFASNSAESAGAIGIDAQALLDGGTELIMATRNLEEENGIKSIVDTTFSNNRAVTAGAIGVSVGRVVELISRSVFKSNEARLEEIIERTVSGGEVQTRLDASARKQVLSVGGAIGVGGGMIIDILDTTFEGNSADDGVGGAIANIAVEVEVVTPDPDPVTEAARLAEFVIMPSVIKNIERSTFNENTAQFGGALMNVLSTTEIANSTFSENLADIFGGALANSEDIPSTGGGEVLEAFSAISTRAEPMEIELDSKIFVSFSTFAGNEAGEEGGAYYEQPELAKTIHARHNILASSLPGNCGGKLPMDEGNNFADDNTCLLTSGNNAEIMLGELADNGGLTHTIALLGGDPVDGAIDCNGITAGDPDPQPREFFNDQRGFMREAGLQCDAGAHESGYVNVKITKISIPQGGVDFSFSGSDSFGNAADGCEITPFDFLIDDAEMANCTVPVGEYDIAEDVPPGQVLLIFCEDISDIFDIDVANGLLSFTVEQEGDNVDCVFVNSPAEIVVRVMVEPAGANCEFGGTKVETGLDTNQNGSLDDGEVDPAGTFFICNGEPGGGGGPAGPTGPEGPQGPTGEDGEDGAPALTDIDIIPEGDVCPQGGLEIKTGNDTNGNGVLDPEEVTDTQIVCNGENGDDNGGCAMAGPGVTTDGLAGLTLYVLIPAAVFVRRRLIKKTNSK